MIGEVGIALGLDDNDSDVHRILAAVNLACDDHEKALFHEARAPSLNPDNHLHYRLDSDREHLCEGLRKPGLPA